MSTQTLTFTQTVSVPPAEVYRAFTNGMALREWLCDSSQCISHVGGRLYLWWNSGFYANGEFTTLEPPSKVSFTWHGRGEPAATRVAISITSQDGDALITLEHSEILAGPEWEHTRQQITDGWKTSLENLKSVLETGEDLRFTRRPMLGIGIDEYNAEIAQKLGVPVIEGLRISNLIEGMGAQAASLQKDDVIVQLGGQPVKDWGSLANALHSYQAGDPIEVVFYRDSQKMDVTMELSRRPLPKIPPTAEALSDTIAAQYERIKTDLDKTFEGVSMAEASFRTAAEEWSAMDVLAHLIHTERGLHTWIADLVTSQEAYYDDFGGNLQARIAATLFVYPTIEELRSELRRNCAETVRLLAALPDEFIGHRGSFWRLAYMIVEIPFHTDSHLDQIRAAVAAARKA